MQKPYTCFWMLPSSMTLSDLWPRFQGHAILTLNVRRVCDRDIDTMRATYTYPTQVCQFELPWVTLSDLTKYSVARRTARPQRQLSFLFLAPSVNDGVVVAERWRVRVPSYSYSGRSFTLGSGSKFMCGHKVTNASIIGRRLTGAWISRKAKEHSTPTRTVAANDYLASRDRK